MIEYWEATEHIHRGLKGYFSRLPGSRIPELGNTWLDTFVIKELDTNRKG
jgi:hypothetical protein